MKGLWHRLSRVHRDILIFTSSALKTWVLHVNTFYSWILLYISPVTAVNISYFPYHCISLIYFSFTMIRMFLYAQIYWLAEFGDISCLQFNYLRVETLTPIWEDLVGHLSDNLVGQFGRTFVGHLSVWSPTKLSVRPECLIVDTLGGICRYKFNYLAYVSFLRIVVSSTYCVMFLFCLTWLYVPYATSFSRLSILDCHFAFL